jgi:Flp pilus assembly pilin Flp
MLRIIDLGLNCLIRDRRAVTALEYALVAAGIAAVVLAAFGLLGNDISNSVTGVGGDL